MMRSEESGLTVGFIVVRGRTRVSLLQFANDIIFFYKASLVFLQNLNLILSVFGQLLGLKINLEKNIFFGINGFLVVIRVENQFREEHPFWY